MAIVTPSQIHIFDDPESKISFLETTFDDKDWRTNIVYPNNDQKSLLQRAQVKEKLQKRGYAVSDSIDAHGQHVLTIHHFGEGSKTSDVFRELGLAKGTLHTITHPALPLGDMLNAGKSAGHLIKDTLSDPARANGLVYITAEIFLTLAGLGNKDTGKAKASFFERMKQPRNFLQSLAGAFFLSQSLIFFAFARNNEDQAMDAIKKKTQHPSDPNTHDTSQLAFNPEHDAPKNNIGSNLTRIVQKYPIQIGALFNDLGMVAYIGHAYFNRKHHLKTPHLPESANYIKKGFGRDIGGAITSLVAWTLLLIPSKKKDPKTEPKHEESSNPISGLINHFKENPEHGTGLLTVASSTQRLLGGISKGNRLQVIGESIYLPGDFFLLFTKNSEYGGDNKQNTEVLAKKLAEHFNAMPNLMGPEAQQQLASSAATFLRDNAIYEKSQHHKNKGQTVQELDAQAKELAHATLRILRATQNERFEHFAEVVAKLVHKFPETQRTQITAALSQTLSQLEWVHAKPAEIQALVQHSLTHTPVASAYRPMKNINDISHEVNELSEVIPGINAGQSGSVIYDTLLPFMREAQTTNQPASPLKRIQAASAKVTGVTDTSHEKAGNNPVLAV